MEACEEIERESKLDATICKNLFLCNRQQTNFYLLMMPKEKQFKTAIISSQIGSSRLSFAPEEYMVKFLDITPGSVSVLGLMNDKDCRVQLLIDEDVLRGEYVGCHPCINTSSLRLRTTDLVNVIIPALRHPARIVHL
jgi:Ala-tRNA(Pro) deacylase